MTLRPPREDEFDAMLELMNAHQLAAFGEADVTAEELRTWLTTPAVDVARDVRVLERDGRLVGYADVDSDRDEPPRWWCDVKIAPDAPVGQVLPELVGWLEERAAEGRLEVWTGARDDRVVSAFTTLGFRPVRHSYRMEIDLDGAVPEPAWPEGVTVREVAEGEERSVYDVFAEVWRDTSAPLTEPWEDWSHWVLRPEVFDRSLWFLAESGDGVAGFSLCRRDLVDAAAGHVELLGVTRAHRQRGLGLALLRHSFQAIRDRGWTRATLGVDASSPTGALRLYERAGMRAYRDTLFLDRPVRV